MGESAGPLSAGMEGTPNAGGRWPAWEWSSGSPCSDQAGGRPARHDLGEHPAEPQGPPPGDRLQMHSASSSPDCGRRDGVSSRLKSSPACSRPGGSTTRGALRMPAFIPYRDPRISTPAISFSRPTQPRARRTWWRLRRHERFPCQRHATARRPLRQLARPHFRFPQHRCPPAWPG